MLAYLDTLIGFAVVMLGASLLITILTQMVSGLFSHRGTNLKWGLVTLLQHIPDCPVINRVEHAGMVATDILSHPLISDSIFSMRLPIPIPKWLADRFVLATAIDPDELVAILKDLACKPAYQAIAGLPAEIETITSAPNPAAARRIGLLTGLSTLPANDALPLLKDTLNGMKDEAGKLEAWFNATMDRVSSRFTTYIRLWTVTFAVTFAGITGLNSVTLLSTLYTNGDFRQQLVSAGPQMSDLANRVAPTASSDAAAKMYSDLVAKALQGANVKLGDTPANIQSEADARKWIGDHVTDSASQSAALAAFDKALTNERVEDAAAIRTILSKSSFDILQFRWDQQKPVLPQLPGVLATAALLSLGAPFWYNMLKQLTNLRPLLANKEDSSN